MKNHNRVPSGTSAEAEDLARFNALVAQGATPEEAHVAVAAERARVAAYNRAIQAGASVEEAAQRAAGVEWGQPEEPRATLTPEMAQSDPERFKMNLLEHMDATTELGREAFTKALDIGTARYDNIHFDPDGWPSASQASTGYIKVGVGEMSPAEKKRYLFGGETMSYEDEVTRRFMHEVNHGLLVMAKDLPDTNNLLRLLMRLRKLHDDVGITPLGSHQHYKTPGNKSVEDAVELLTMRQMSEAHFEDYLKALYEPRFAGVRNEKRLPTYDEEQAGMLRGMVENSVAEALNQGGHVSERSRRSAG